MDITVRGDVPVGMLRFYAGLPDKLIEVSRLQMSIAHLRQMAEVFCRVLDYYPERPTSRPGQPGPPREQT